MTTEKQETAKELTANSLFFSRLLISRTYSGAGRPSKQVCINTCIQSLFPE